MSLPKRKQNRVKGYDYGSNGAYFVTVCTKDKKNMLWAVGETIGLPRILLSDIGKLQTNRYEIYLLADIHIEKHISC